MTNFFHAPKVRTIVCNINGIYSFEACFHKGAEGRRQWWDYFKSLNAIHWRSVVEDSAIYLVSTIGGGFIHPMGFSFALNCESDINFENIKGELVKIISSICKELGGEATFEIA